MGRPAPGRFFSTGVDRVLACFTRVLLSIGQKLCLFISGLCSFGPCLGFLSRAGLTVLAYLGLPLSDDWRLGSLRAGSGGGFCLR